MTDFNVNNTTVQASSLMESALKPVWNSSKLYDTSINPSLSDDSKSAVSGSVLIWDKTHKYWTIGSIATGGNVIGPDTSNNNTIPRFDSTTGKIIKGSDVTIDDSNKLSVPGTIEATGNIQTDGNINILSATGKFYQNSNIVPSLDDTSTTSTENTYSCKKINDLVAGAGSGDVVGPTGSDDNRVTRFDGVTGKKIKSSGVTIDDTNNLTVPNNINNFGLITSQGYRMQLDNAVDIGETTKQVKDLYIKGNINTLGDIKYNKTSQNIQLGINAGGTTQGVGCVDNISIGQGSNPALTTGNNNISLGKDSGKLINTGISNVCIGPEAGKTISSGVDNIILGNNAGASLDSGNSNIFIGTSSTGGSGVLNAIAIGSVVTNNVSNSCVIGNTACTNIRPSGDRLCDLGTSSNRFDNIYGDRVILNEQAQSNKYYNKDGLSGIDIANTTNAAVTLTGSKYSGHNNSIVTLNGSGLIQQPSDNATVDGNGNAQFKNLNLLNIASSGLITCKKIQSNDAANILELFNRSTANGVGISIDATTAGNIQLTGATYNGGATDRIFTVAADGTMKLSSATLDNVGNLTASNTTLASLQLQNNLSGNTATFTGQINSNAIIPVTTNIADLGSTTNGFKNIYIEGDVFKNGVPLGGSGGTDKFIGAISPVYPWTILDDSNLRIQLTSAGSAQPFFLNKDPTVATIYYYVQNLTGSSTTGSLTGVNTTTNYQITGPAPVNTGWYVCTLYGVTSTNTLVYGYKFQTHVISSGISAWSAEVRQMTV